MKLEKILRARGRSLRDFPLMPFPDSQFFQFERNRLIHDEMRYDTRSLTEEHKKLMSNLNDEQRRVYQSIIKSCNLDVRKIFFMYGYGGTGKTFIWKILSTRLRSKGEIVLNVASSGIASLLLPGGRTAHFRFSIPSNPNEESVCNIKQGSPLAELIVKSKLIIWDEAPMIHKFYFEALDRSMRDIMKIVNPSRANISFGGKTIVFGRDFWQILLVIPKGSRQEIVHATINSSYLWRTCTILRLTKNMRLQTIGDYENREELKHFADWIAKISDEKIA